MTVSPLIVGMLVRVATGLLVSRGPAVAEAIIAARHPESDGGRRLTKGERKAVAREILFRVSEGVER